MFVPGGSDPIWTECIAIRANGEQVVDMNQGKYDRVKNCTYATQGTHIFWHEGGCRLIGGKAY